MTAKLPLYNVTVWATLTLCSQHLNVMREAFDLGPLPTGDRIAITSARTESGDCAVCQHQRPAFDGSGDYVF